MTHLVNRFQNTIYVTGQHPDLDDALARLGGTRGANYEFPDAAEAEVRELVDAIHAANGEAPHPPQGDTRPGRTGWSKHSRRPSRSHPLGEVTHAGNGFTEYEDTTFGGGRVQIWDQS